MFLKCNFCHNVSLTGCASLQLTNDIIVLEKCVHCGRKVRQKQHGHLCKYFDLLFITIYPCLFAVSHGKNYLKKIIKKKLRMSLKEN